MATNAATVTDEQISALAVEANAAGDEAQADMCALALAGNEAARIGCERVIRSARAARAEVAS